MPWCLLLRDHCAALRPTAILHADAHFGWLGAGVVTYFGQPAIGALGMPGFDGRLGQAVVFDGLGRCQAGT